MNEKKMDNKIQKVNWHYRVSSYGVFTFGRIFLMILFLGCLAVGLYLGMYSSSKKTPPIPSPDGMISSPFTESSTGNIVQIKGYTRNIISKNSFVWLVIEKPDEGLCWPQNKALPENCEFSVSINAKGHMNAYNLSLYSVDKVQNNVFLDWITKRDSSKGVSLQPHDIRLYSVRLWNQI